MTNLIILENWLLPKGRLELRITQTEVLQLIARHFKHGERIALGVQSSEGSFLPCMRHAVDVQVVDFFQLDDESLSFVFEGVQRLKVCETHPVSESLWQAKVRRLPDWPEQGLEKEFKVLSRALEYFYQTNPDISELYSHVHLEDANWVSQRWLEVLPIIDQDKLHLVNQPDCSEAMSFVLKMIIEQQIQ
ncbi:LON peptidase substrate-binding domain-containing protein [Paraferrimonas sedimenticola]|nr:LON peptidase substrate-binding domain-containing protein [Paraferrimonas sedimenticola]